MQWYSKLANALSTLTEGTIEYTHTKADITTSSTAALAANTDRKYTLLINISDTDIYLKADGNAAVVGRGIYLKANGGSYEMSPRIGNLTTAAIKGIHDGAGNKGLLVTEGE